MGWNEYVVRVEENKKENYTKNMLKSKENVYYRIMDERKERVREREGEGARAHAEKRCENGRAKNGTACIKDRMRTVKMVVNAKERQRRISSSSLSSSCVLATECGCCNAKCMARPYRNVQQHNIIYLLSCCENYIAQAAAKQQKRRRASIRPQWQIGSTSAASTHHCCRQRNLFFFCIYNIRRTADLHRSMLVAAAV